MISQLKDGRLMLLKLQIFLLDLIDSDTNNVNHISKDSCSDYLNHCHNYGFYKIIGCEISVTNSDHGCIGPIERVNIVDVPMFVGQLGLIDPRLTAFGTKICH